MAEVVLFTDKAMKFGMVNTSATTEIFSITTFYSNFNFDSLHPRTRRTQHLCLVQ